MDRYSDSDVSKNLKRLRKKAVKLLSHYQGSNTFLVSVQRQAAAGQKLTVGQVRGVLNCMQQTTPIQNYQRQHGESKPYIEETCPLIGTEHDRHWFPLEHRSGSQHCIGWHALHRKITYTDARFHADYLRGASSNLIHRSVHTGSLCWFPPFYSYGPARITSWRVMTRCFLPALKNPTLLDAAGVKTAKPYKVHHTNPHKEITLCAKCFPTGGAPVVLTTATSVGEQTTDSEVLQPRGRQNLRTSSRRRGSTCFLLQQGV